jgi:hypothetical protein
MNTARNLALNDIRLGAIDQASSKNAETPACAHQRSRLALRRISDVRGVKSGSEQQSPKRGTSINMARYGVARQSTAQK